MLGFFQVSFFIAQNLYAIMLESKAEIGVE